MSRMGEYLIELEEDFENLTETSMEFHKADWADQIEEGRFEFSKYSNYDFIYWFSDYASLFAAKSILRTIGEQYETSWDAVSESWVIVSDYVSNVWKRY